MDYIMRRIGVIRTPFTAKDTTPIQASRSRAMGRVEPSPGYAEGLKDLEGFSHTILL